MARTARIARIAQAVRSGDRRRLGRALTLAECGSDEGRDLLQALHADMGRAQIIGVTGPPGAGKSTLVDALIRVWRERGQRIAVLAVDPVSPVSGGAVLGDRTRMGAHSLDEGVFIRSVSARGHLGGLCAAAHDMADLMDAAGWPLILIETVGAGQSETEIAQVADISMVISAPGLGDELQAIKAGILEIADVLVVNKADREGAGRTAKQLEDMLALRGGARRDVPVLQVTATNGTGVTALCDALERRLAEAPRSRAEKRRRHAMTVAAHELARRICAGELGGAAPNGVSDEVMSALNRALAAGQPGAKPD